MIVVKLLRADTTLDLSQEGQSGKETKSVRVGLYRGEGMRTDQDPYDPHMFAKQKQIPRVILWLITMSNGLPRPLEVDQRAVTLIRGLVSQEMVWCSLLSVLSLNVCAFYTKIVLKLSRSQP